MEQSINLLDINRGAVTAPAGCGKTHLIVEAIKKHSSSRPILVLTHTNAGVAALRSRIGNEGVASSSYRIATIDGWAMRIISMFPTRSNNPQDILELTNPQRDYPKIREAACKLLKAGHIGDLIQASYSRLLVDEYQDCSIRQHAIVFHAANLIPTCVLGDTLQSIFGFNHRDPLVDWDKYVCDHFPVVCELTTPWRWENAGATELGKWLLDVRKKLLSEEAVDLETAPASVSWVELDGENDHEKLLRASRSHAPDGNGRVLIIGNSRNASSRYQIARSVPGAVTVEAVDLKDLVSFSNRLDLGSDGALGQIVEFAQSLMSNVGAPNFLKRVRTIIAGRARKSPTEAEAAAICFLEKRTYQNVLDLLASINQQGGVRLYRPAVLRACIRALNNCISNNDISLYDAACEAREQNRFQGRSIPNRAVGSTLLLKGLEAEVAVVLNAAELNARNLYVAMTRGSKSLIICSPSSQLSPDT